MISFKELINEDKNTHMEHLEDEIINNGVAGAKTAIQFLNSLKDMLSGGKSKTNITVKWDGAPAIFAGINPENGKFFVATKSLFNKIPKINYTKADIDAEIVRLQAEYDAQAYARARQPLYPAIGDQLDDLYHAGAFSAEMTATLKKVKDDNPK